MRLVIVIVILAAGGCSGRTGALLELHMTGGGSAAITEVDVVLAVPNPAVTGERSDELTIQPPPASESATYYIQHQSGGVYVIGSPSDATPSLALPDGRTLLVEHEDGEDGANGDVTHVAPFVIAYGVDGNGLAVVAAIGIYNENGDGVTPATIDIDGDKVREYPITMSAPTVATPGAGDLVANSAAVLVAKTECGSGSASTATPTAKPWTSGVVWEIAADNQLRILLPDPAMSATTALNRPVDLDNDCDPVTVNNAIDDCDDLDPGVYVGATEMCDGINESCDGLIEHHGAASSCTPDPTNACEMTAGASDCVELDPAHVTSTTACPTSEQCVCSNVSSGANPGTDSGCTYCVLELTDDRTPCTPAIASIPISGCGSGSDVCVVTPGPASMPWEVMIYNPTTGSNAPEQTVNSASAAVYFEVSGPSPAGNPPQDPEISLIVTGGIDHTTRPILIDLRLQPDDSSVCEVSVPALECYAAPATGDPVTASGK